jgi:hypothetical protein
MAELTSAQLKKMLDSGMTPSEIQRAAQAAGDTVPGPSLIGSLASPVITVATRIGQTIGAGISHVLGGNKEVPLATTQVLKAPILGTVVVPGQQPLNTPRGVQQILGQAGEVAALATPVGRIASKLAPVVGKTLGFGAGLGTSGYLTETGLKLQEGAENPYTPGLGTAIPAAIPIVGKALSAGLPATAKALRFGVAKASGLTPDDITTIITKPNEFQAAKASGLNRINLGEMVNTRFTQLSDEVSELGPAYTNIRMLETPVTYKTNPFQEVLTKRGIGFEDGRIKLSKDSPALTGGDVSAIERVYSQYGFDNTLTPNQYLNFRQALDDIINWNAIKDPTRTKHSVDIAKELRRAYDSVAKVQVKGLKEADEAFAPVKSELGSLKKDFLTFRDNQWTLSDTALTKIANATNKGRTEILKRLENYVPGITQQIQLVRALEGIEASSGNKVGAYAQSLLFGGGLLAVGSNPAFALITLAMAMPEVMVPILVKFGQLRGIAEKTMRGLAGKILAGKTLTEQELLLYKNAILEHLNKVSPGDQFFDSPLGQRSLAYARSIRPGLTVRDINKDPFPGDELLKAGSIKSKPNTFTPPKDLSTKLLEKFRGLPEEITPQQFNEVINRAQKEGIKKVDLDMVREAAERQGNDIVKAKASGQSFDEWVKGQGETQVGKNLSRVADDSSGGALVREIAYPANSIQEKLDMLAKLNPEQRTLENFKKYYDPTPNQISTGKVYGLDIPSAEQAYKGLFPAKTGMELPTRSVFNDQTKGMMNSIREVGGVKIGNVGWHNKPWKVVETSNFDEITPRSYEPNYKAPIAEFRTRDELWSYLREQSKPSVKTRSQLKAEWDKADSISLPQLAKDVEKQLVPLTPTPVKSPRWANIGEDFIGDGKYGEIVYQSPIKTSAGSIHFAGTNEYMDGGKLVKGEKFPNYFSHVRYEDKGTTRKLMEVQSDLMQKENFAQENKGIRNFTKAEQKEYDALLERQHSHGDDFATYKKEQKRMNELLEGATGRRTEEMKSLSAYESNDPLAHLRTFREEVKRAAKDGKDTLLVPTGETALRIEGLGVKENWVSNGKRINDISELQVGKEVSQVGEQGGWIITDVLGDGKFKAVQKSEFEQMKDINRMEAGSELEGVDAKTLFEEDLKYAREYGNTETFDISGKVDTKHFVYKLNEEAFPKEARKQGLIVEGKISQDNGEWWVIKIPPEKARMPVEAFGLGAIPLLGEQDE